MFGKPNKTLIVFTAQKFSSKIGSIYATSAWIGVAVRPAAVLPPAAPRRIFVPAP